MRKNYNSKNNFQIVKTKNLKMQTLLCQKVSQWLPEKEVITKGKEEISGVMDISIVLIVGWFHDIYIYQN